MSKDKNVNRRHMRLRGKFEFGRKVKMSKNKNVENKISKIKVEVQNERWRLCCRS
jgi:hypothetical protein